MTTTPPPSLGGYTPESLAQEVTNRSLAQIQLEVRARGAKLSKRDRDLVRMAATIGGSHMLKIIGEITAEQAQS